MWLGMAFQHQSHLEVHGAAPEQIGGRAPGRGLFQIAAMQVRADAEHEIDVDVRMALRETIEQRLAIAALGGREQHEALARHQNAEPGEATLRHAGIALSWRMTSSLLLTGP